MNRKIIMYTLFFVLGIISGVGGYYLISGNSYPSEHQHVDEEGQLYTCGMHPEIIETEPGDCPICGMKLLPVKGSKAAQSGERKILYWRAPMNPNEIYDAPGKSQMGMDLVPVYEDEGGASGVVTVDGAMLQSMNVKIDHVIEREIQSEVTTNGILKIDERKEFSINTKIGGWIENLYVNYTGQKIKKGEKLIDIYSPELVAAQQELLTAISYQKVINTSLSSATPSSNDDLVKNAIKKLELYDISNDDIDELINTGEIKKYMTIYAPFNGTVLNKAVSEGEKIVPGKELLNIADLSNLWLIADVYESDLNKLTIGSKAKINFSYNPNHQYNGEVSFIYPTVDERTRTVQIRINLNNSNGELKPNMFGNVTIKGNGPGVQITVPEIAVIRSGKKNLAVLSLGDGKFKPVEVKLGLYSNGYYQVLKGLKRGDMIVKSAQFLLDSESSLRSAVELFSSTDTDEDPTMNMNDEIDEKEEKITSTIDEMPKDMDGHDHGSIIRTGIIDVESIDLNNDGKVYQDFMDWNVISDEPGRCPICNMILQEVTIEEAKKNLKENGFEYK